MHNLQENGGTNSLTYIPRPEHDMQYAEYVDPQAFSFSDRSTALHETQFVENKSYRMENDSATESKCQENT